MAVCDFWIFVSVLCAHDWPYFVFLAFETIIDDEGVENICGEVLLYFRFILRLVLFFEILGRLMGESMFEVGKHWQQRLDFCI